MLGGVPTSALIVGLIAAACFAAGALVVHRRRRRLAAVHLEELRARVRERLPEIHGPRRPEEVTEAMRATGDTGTTEVTIAPAAQQVIPQQVDPEPVDQKPADEKPVVPMDTDPDGEHLQEVALDVVRLLQGLVQSIDQPPPATRTPSSDRRHPEDPEDPDDPERRSHSAN